MSSPHAMTLRVDCRERAVIAALGDLQSSFSASVNLMVQQLDAGDFVIEHNSSNVACSGSSSSSIPLVCERKTLADLVSSVLDKRFIEQKQRMLAMVKGQARNVMYIIENETNPFSLDPGQTLAFSGGMTAGAVQTILLDMQLVHGMSVVVTGSPEETARLLVRMTRRLSDKPERYAELFSGRQSDAHGPTSASTTSPAYASCVKVKKADNIDPITCATLQLMVVPGVSSSTARAILEHFQVADLKSLYDRLTDRTPEDIVSAIADIRGLTSSGRRIGKSLATTIVRFMFSAPGQ